MDPWQKEYVDFYPEYGGSDEGHAWGSRCDGKKGTGIDGFYHGIYLSCLLLFGKPGYMDIPVAEHFAQGVLK
jgi:hypothetical protein